MIDGTARFRDRWARGVVEVRHGDDALAALDSCGFWAVVWTFEGELTAVRFAQTHRGEPPTPPVTAWTPVTGWTSSLDRDPYQDAVQATRELIRQGEVYQVNICRVLSAPLRDDADLAALDILLRQGNPAPYGCQIHCPAAGLDIASASPELFLARRGDRLTTRPIKGTAATAAGLLPKDQAENVMIVDLMRNDLSRVCEVGSVVVEALCAVEPHPGLVHLVSTVTGQLRPGTGWQQIHRTTAPAGSVSGAPKSSALRTIERLEPRSRGPYCGAIGWVDADTAEAELAVGIRTFWADGAPGRRRIHFGTGAGITWESDPEREWQETELKAARLIRLAGGAS